MIRKLLNICLSFDQSQTAEVDRYQPSDIHDLPSQRVHVRLSRFEEKSIQITDRDAQTRRRGIHFELEQTRQRGTCAAALLKGRRAPMVGVIDNRASVAVISHHFFGILPVQQKILWCFCGNYLHVFMPSVLWVLLSFRRNESLISPASRVQTGRFKAVVAEVLQGVIQLKKK